MLIHDTAIVDPRAQIHDTVDVGPYSVIEGMVEIGANTILGPHVYITGKTSIGCDCRIHANAVIGDLPQDQAYNDGESSCQIGDGTIIREGVTIHRGTKDGTATIVGRNCFIMVNAHIGHNCKIGNDVVLVNGSLLGGYVEVGDRAVISGNAAVHQFCRIGKLAMISGLAKITRDIPPFFMTDRDGFCVGANLVGLKRAGYSADDRTTIKQVYRQIFGKTMSAVNIVEQLQQISETELVLQLIDFFQGSSTRGITASRPRDIATS